MADNHHVKVHKLRELYFPWSFDCSCGRNYRGSEWRSVFDWGFNHVIHQADAEPQELVDLLPLVKTKLAWDLLDHAEMNTWLPRLGLVPAADDMDELEHTEAHARASKVVPLASLAETYSAVVADIQTVYFAHESGNENQDNSGFTDFVFRMIRSGVFAILGEFLADGIIGYGPAFARVKQ